MALETKKIAIKGMHCKSCTVLIADELNKIPKIMHASVSLKNNNAVIQYLDFDKPTDEQIERAIEKAGYAVGSEKTILFSRDKSTYIQFGFGLFWVIIIFMLIKKIGFYGFNLDFLSDNKGLMALVIGVTAGFSTCMALVGGLTLGLSARYAEKNQSATAIQKFKPHLFFNLGRILSFFVLGGVIGLFGSFINLSSSITGLLMIIVGLVMLILGLQLTELFPRLANKGISLPSGILKLIGLDKQKQKQYSHRNAMMLGALTFLLPCGFTQTMQLVAISSGNFMVGSIVMGLFAIGTAPGLLGVGGLTALVKGNFAKIFFRFVGVIVIALSIYNISNGFNLTGHKLTFPSWSTTSSDTMPIDENAIVLNTVFKPTRSAVDIDPNTFDVEVGKTYVLTIDAKSDGEGCMSTIMIPGVYEKPLLIKKGIMKLQFKINKPGVYEITCAMGIVRGFITATNGGVK